MKTKIKGPIMDFLMCSISEYRYNFFYQTNDPNGIPELSIMTTEKTREDLQNSFSKNSLSENWINVREDKKLNDCFTYNFAGVRIDHYAIEHLNDDDIVFVLSSELEIVDVPLRVNLHCWTSTYFLDQGFKISPVKYYEFVPVVNLQKLNPHVNNTEELEARSDLLMYILSTDCVFRPFREPKFSPYEMSFAILERDYYKYIFKTLRFDTALRFAGDHAIDKISDRIEKTADDYNVKPGAEIISGTVKN